MLGKFKKNGKRRIDIDKKPSIVCIVIVITSILVATPLILGKSDAWATPLSFEPFSAQEEPQQEENGSVQEQGATNATTNATLTSEPLEPGSTGTGPSRPFLAESNATLGDEAGEVALMPEPIGPIDRVPDICNTLPGGCPPDLQCPPECLIVAAPGDIQQGNIAALEFHTTMNETMTMAGESEVVPTETSQFIVGTPDQIESIAIEGVRSLSTDAADQVTIARIEETVNGLTDLGGTTDSKIKICITCTLSRPIECSINAEFGKGAA